MLGPDAVNMDKIALEGLWRECGTVWGVDMDTRSLESSLPDKRILKGAYLFAQPVYDTGNKHITLLDIQRARGTGQAWLPAVPYVGPELQIMDHFLTPVPGPWAAPTGTPEEQEEKWGELWGAFEFFRLLSARPELWSARFTAGL